MSTVRAKFHCHSVKTVEGQKTYQGPLTDPLTEVHLQAVYGDGTDNAAWSTATPSGFVKMLITNPAAAGAFVAGQEYWLDFTPVEPAAPAATSTDAGNVVVTGVDGNALGVMQSADPSPAPAEDPAATDAPAAEPTIETAPAQAA